MYTGAIPSGSTSLGPMSRSPRWTSAVPVRNVPWVKHIGAEPSQQPPDWWNISGLACWSRRLRSRSAAFGVIATRSTVIRAGSEEALGVLGVRHQQVLGLLVVVEHHQVVLAADAR